MSADKTASRVISRVISVGHLAFRVPPVPADFQWLSALGRRRTPLPAAHPCSRDDARSIHLIEPYTCLIPTPDPYN